jgi:hypothetical protein
MGNALPQLVQNGATREFLVAQTGQLTSSKLIAPVSDPAHDELPPLEGERTIWPQWAKQRSDPVAADLPQTTHFGHGFKLRRKLSIQNWRLSLDFGQLCDYRASESLPH